MPVKQESSKPAGQTKKFGKSEREVPHHTQKAKKFYPAEDEYKPKKVLRSVLPVGLLLYGIFSKLGVALLVAQRSPTNSISDCTQQTIDPKAPPTLMKELLLIRYLIRSANLSTLLSPAPLYNLVPFSSSSLVVSAASASFSSNTCLKASFSSPVLLKSTAYRSEE